MNIFPSEKSLQDLILNETKAFFDSQISLIEDKLDLFINNLNQIKENGCSKELADALTEVAACGCDSNNKHPDLMYGSAILVSTVMNGNDDVFLAEEVWSAKDTPINTPYNDNHQKKNIIGHILASRIINQSNNANENSIPDYFDLEADFVVYKSIYPEIAKDIYEKAPKGEKFVSMECKFNDFGYALIDNEGNATIIDRNESTAFLTKHLRVYKGSGKYKEYRIGRVLKDIRFTGMGNVSKPANRKSEYTKLENYSKASEINEKITFYIEEDDEMKKLEKIETLEQAEALISSLTKEIDTLKIEKDQNKVEELNKTIATLTGEKTDLTNKLAEANSKITVAEQSVKDLNDKLTEAKKTIDTTKAELDTKIAELKKINDEAKAQDRFAKLKEIGFDLKEEKKAAMASLDDESFASVLDFAQSMKPKEENKKEETKIEVKEETKAAVEDTKGDTESVEANIKKVADKLVQVLIARKTSIASKSSKNKE